MTRGTLVLITKSAKMIESTQFNGDMGHYSDMGKFVLNGLSKVKSIKDFNKFVEDVNNEGYHYPEQLTFVIEEGLIDSFESKNYFYRWHSDYIYIKNLLKENIQIKDFNGEFITIPTNEVTLLNFGKKIDF